VPDWSLLSRHGQTLQLIHTKPHFSQAQIADRLGVNLRTVNRVFGDLREAGYIVASPAHRHLGHVINIDATLDNGTALIDWLRRQSEQN